MALDDENIRRYLSQQSDSVPAQPRMRMVPQRRQAEPSAYKDFSATHLFCGKCQQAMPVREKLLLVLPDGDLYDYVCTGCGTSTGTRRAGE